MKTIYQLGFIFSMALFLGLGFGLSISDTVPPRSLLLLIMSLAVMIFSRWGAEKYASPKSPTSSSDGGKE